MQAVTKKCSKCGEEKELGAFGPDKRMHSGLRSACKSCNSSKQASDPYEWLQRHTGTLNPALWTWVHITQKDTPEYEEKE